MEEVALIADIDQTAGGADRVLLMTLHAAKGLEFPRVFLAGMEDGIFPSYMTMISGDESDMEEERRLAYVGITRAKDVLYLSAAASRMINGQTQYNPPSRFIREIPKELLEDPTGRKRPAKTSMSVSGEKLSQARPWAPKESVRAVRSETAAKSGAAAKPFVLQDLRKGSQLSSGRPDYGVGDRVLHKKFGEGIVKELEKDTKDYKVTVDFESAGTKILYAAFARLEKL